MGEPEPNPQGEATTPNPEEQTSIHALLAGPLSSGQSSPPWYRQPAIVISLISTAIALLSFLNSLITLREQAIESTIGEIYRLLDQAADESVGGQNGPQATLDLSHARLLISNLASRTPATVLLVAGWLIEAEGHFEEARDYYEKAVERADNRYDRILGLRFLGELNFRLGKPDIGRTYYTRALVNPNIKDVDNADDAITYLRWSESEEEVDRQKSEEYKSKAMKYLVKVKWKGDKGRSGPSQDMDAAPGQEQKSSKRTGLSEAPGKLVPRRP